MRPSPVADLEWSCRFLGRCNLFTNVAFIDASTAELAPIVSWAWDFGDGTTSAEQHPRHRYKQVGTYTVRLTVTDQRGRQDTTSRPITITFL